MVIDMNDSQLTTPAQIRDFLASKPGVAFAPAADDAARYRYIAQVLRRFSYPTLPRRTTGYSRAQLTHLLRRHRHAGGLSQRYAAPNGGFRRH